MCPAKSSAFIVPYHPSLKMLLKSLVYLGVLMETQSTTPVRMFEVRHVMLRLKGGAGRENGNAPVCRVCILMCCESVRVCDVHIRLYAIRPLGSTSKGFDVHILL